MYGLYRLATSLFSPLVPLVLRRRLARGKEDGARIKERTGIASLPRPAGKLIWIHAASVGEANAALPLVEALVASSSALHVLLTTVTTTSAQLMQSRLPTRAIHQFAPVDTLSAVDVFLAHWKPEVALWVDSELWPNLIMETRRRGIVMGLINARMSPRSFKAWNYALSFIRELLSCFEFCFAQSKEDAVRLRTLGMRTVACIGNLKYDAPELPYDAQALQELQASLNGRPVWLAASTHPGEEEMIARAHEKIAVEFPNVLTILVPRHARRGSEIREKLAPFSVCQRSNHESLTPATSIYLADTMGELGLFYRLAPIAFIGGSLVPHGGQNPIEPARLGAALLVGPYTGNFAEIYQGFEQAKACQRVREAQTLASAVIALLKNPQAVGAYVDNAHAHVQAQAGQVGHIMNELQPYLA